MFLIAYQLINQPLQI